VAGGRGEAVLNDGRHGPLHDRQRRSRFTPEFHDRIVDEAALRRRTPEAAEGFASFREKRRPRWYPEK